MTTDQDVVAASIALEIVQSRAGRTLRREVAYALVRLTADFLSGVVEGRCPVEVWEASRARYVAGPAIGLGAVRELADLAASVRALSAAHNCGIAWALRSGMAEA